MPARPRSQRLKYVNGIAGPFDQTRRPAPRPASAHLSHPRHDQQHQQQSGPSAVVPAAPTAPWERHDPRWGPQLGRPRTAGSSVPSTPAHKPAWIAFDGVCLRFFGYFEDMEATKRTGLRRVRRCVVTLYLEDNTVDVREPKQENSGIVQGQLLKRMRVQKPDGSKYEPRDFVVGGSVTLFSRTYVLLACDEFTRAFFEREGIFVAPDIAFPEGRDPPPPSQQPASAPSLTSAHPAPATTSSSSSGANANRAKGRQFLKHDRNVLRFFATSEQPGLGGGDTKSSRAFILHYFLADDTVEVLEVLQRNSGRDPFPKLLRRQRLPKQNYSVGIRPASDDTRRRAGHEYWDWRELRIGAVVNCFGNMLTLRDCDEHTRDWYAAEMGLSEADFAAMPPLPGPPPVPRLEPPAHTSGIGSEEDSLESCYRLVPKPQKKVDYNEWAMNEGQVMRFTGSFVSGPGKPEVNEIDAGRSFVVSFYLEDHSLAVFEPPVPNSGLPGGKFVERRQVKKSHGSKVWLRARDLYVGAVLEVSARYVRLNAADEATLNIMERRPQEFPRSDPGGVIEKLKAGVATLGDRATEALKQLAAREDRALLGEGGGGGGGLVLSRESFLNVMLGVLGLYEASRGGVDAQSLLTLWRSLPKLQFDLNAAPPPKGVRREEDYVRIKDLFDCLGVQL